MSGPAVAVILMKERHVAEALERAGATSSDRAVVPEEQQIATNGIGWRRLTRRSIVREAEPGRWYLDHPRWIAMRRTRRRMTLVLLALVALAAAYIMLTAHTAS